MAMGHRNSDSVDDILNGPKIIKNIISTKEQINFRC
jgi:hypothetical protein